jgi:hypothetical protein
MKSYQVLFVGVGFLVIGLLVGLIAGHRHATFQTALAENKIAAANLRFNQDKLSPQLQEYLKARIYCNVLVQYPNDPGYLLARDWDFGPVDRKVLGDLAIYKDLYKAWSWEEAIAGK